MIHLALRTEYSFKKCYGFIKDLPKIAGDSKAIGIADNNNTFGHIKHHRNCRKNNIKPILGVRLMVCDKFIEVDGKKEKSFGPMYIFIAKNQSGLSEIYSLVKLAYDQFYYHPRLFQVDLQSVSENVIVLANTFNTIDRIDYIAVDQSTPKFVANCYILPRVAVCLNWYTKVCDKITYQLHAEERGMENQSYPQHILSDLEWLHLWPNQEKALSVTYDIAAQCEDYDLPRASMVKYKGKNTLRELCEDGALTRSIDLSNRVYKERFEREMELIEKRNYSDYFLIVAEMVNTSKKKMLVGPSRGSSAGSLVCYLSGITEIDPLKFDLLFERFIDINRLDLPDIDVDFPDRKRKVVIKTLVSLYGEDHVRRIATVSRLQPKSAIGRFAAGLCIPPYETEDLKNAVIDRAKSDARALNRLEDTFDTTEIGQKFINKFPEMRVVQRIEGHASHAGVHAAGIIVANEPLTTYGGINARDSALMMDHKDAESINLLKIDCLGLRTLSILESVADQIGMAYKKFYSIPLDDKKTFDIFNSLRLIGIFQFQGNALKYITRQMGVHTFDDVCAITALGRPGPLHSGGTNSFINRRIGTDPVIYLSEHPSVIAATENTYGVIIYQEQLMMIAREYGQMSWEDVSALRKAASKTLGEEHFGKFKEQFMDGAIRNNAKPEEAEKVWSDIVTFGQYGFNKSHAYGYGLISYWSAWAKAHYPMEFAVANLNHAKDDENAVKLLRDMVRYDSIEYTAFDPDESVADWSVKNGVLLGGLKSIKGIGPKKANEILKARDGKRKFTTGMIKMLRDPDTVFNILFPCEHWWGDFYSKPNEFGLTKAPDKIETISKPGEYLLVGKLIECNLRDLNEPRLLARRDGRYIHENKYFLTMILEDDTESIIVSVNRYNFESIGRDIAENSKVGHDWFLVKGSIKDKWRQVDVSQILNLNHWGRKSGIGPDIPF